MGAVTYIMVATTRARIHKLFGVATHQIGIGVVRDRPRGWVGVRHVGGRAGRESGVVD